MEKEQAIENITEMNLILTMSVKTPGLMRLVMRAVWYTSTQFSSSSWSASVVTAQNIPAVEPPYLLSTTPLDLLYI